MTTEPEESATQHSALSTQHSVGCLLLHGLTSSLATVSNLVPYLEARDIPYVMPTLRGHGTRPEDLRGVTWHETEQGMHWLMEPQISTAGVEQVQQWLRSILTARAVAPDQIGDAELIVEELLTNVVRSLEARGGGAHLSLDCALNQTQIVMTVRDDGPPFDPLALAAPDLEASIEERAIGGLGVAIVRRLAESCRYSRDQGHNVMEVRLPRTPV